MARKTEWAEVAEGCYHGLGQRMFSTDAGDHALLDIREVNLETSTDDQTEPGTADG